jgi:hypothetical protein
MTNRLGQGKELKAPGRCKYCLPSIARPEQPNRTKCRIVHSTIMCKTEEGFWCDFSAPPKAIKLIKEYILATDPTLENF